jgi:hypothetical protein
MTSPDAGHDENPANDTGPEDPFLRHSAEKGMRKTGYAAPIIRCGSDTFGSTGMP